MALGELGVECALSGKTKDVRQPDEARQSPGDTGVHVHAALLVRAIQARSAAGHS